MFPEDRVLVGVINRKRDFTHALNDHWYRIPQVRMSRGVNAEYLAFFLSGRVFKERSGGVHYYARVRGFELLYRRDILPGERNHPRADEVYYKIALADLTAKDPPVLNPTRRSIAFIRTTWDRFVHAQTIADLYSESDYYVDRIYHALRTRTGIASERFWETETRDYAFAPGVRIMCEQGVVTASTVKGPDVIHLDRSGDEDATMRAIIEAIQAHGGPLTTDIPYEGF